MSALGLPGLIVVLVLLAGCGTSGDRAQADRVVQQFYDAVRHGNGQQACAQLSESTVMQLESQMKQPCPNVITRLQYAGGPIVRTSVYVKNAKVDLRNDESAFLEREPSGWRLSAVGCRPEGKPEDRPLECEAQA